MSKAQDEHSCPYPMCPYLFSHCESCEFNKNATGEGRDGIND